MVLVSLGNVTCGIFVPSRCSAIEATAIRKVDGPPCDPSTVEVRAYGDNPGSGNLQIEGMTMADNYRPVYDKVRVLMLALCLLILGCSGTRAGTLQGTIESASAKTAFSLPTGTIRAVTTANNVVGVELSTVDSSIIQLLSSDGRLLFHHARLKAGSRNSVYGLSISRNGSTFVFSEDLGDRDWRRTAFTRDGKELFAIEFPGHIKPSPSGEYFTNIPNSITGAAFTILARDGKPIRAFGAESTLWENVFISDETIVTASPDSARWIDASTGEIERIVPLRLTTDEPAPRMEVSFADSIVVIFDEHAIALVSFSGRILWESNFNDFVYAVYPRAEGEFIAIQFGVPGENRGYIRVLSTASPEQSADSPITDFMTSDVIQRQRTGWYSGDIVAIWGPARYVLTDFHSGVAYKTLFYRIQAQPLAVIAETILPEIYAPISIDNGFPALMRVAPDENIAVKTARTSFEESGVN